MYCSVKADLLSVRVEALTQAHRIAIRGEKLHHLRTNSDQDNSVIVFFKMANAQLFAKIIPRYSSS